MQDNKFLTAFGPNKFLYMIGLKDKNSNDIFNQYTIAYRIHINNTISFEDFYNKIILQNESFEDLTINYVEIVIIRGFNRRKKSPKLISLLKPYKPYI
jgi:hypothetical protein